MSTRRRFRRQKFIDKKQQLRFAMELGLYALLFPMFFLVLSLADPIASQLMGNDTGKLQPLYSLLSFCMEHWWEFLFALGLVGFISILFSHRIVGPIRRFENALIQKAQHPTEPVNCKVRSKDYFQDFSGHLDTFLNSHPAFAGSGDAESSPEDRGREAYDGDTEVSR